MENVCLAIATNWIWAGISDTLSDTNLSEWEGLYGRSHSPLLILTKTIKMLSSVEFVSVLNLSFGIWIGNILAQARKKASSG